MFFSFQQFKYLSNELELEQFYSSSSSSSSLEKIFFRVQVQVRVRQNDRVLSSSSSSSQPWHWQNITKTLMHFAKQAYCSVSMQFSSLQLYRARSSMLSANQLYCSSTIGTY